MTEDASMYPKGPNRVRDILKKLNAEHDLEESPIYQQGYKYGYKTATQIEGNYSKIALKQLINLYHEVTQTLRE
jgi:hypothetical protein